MPHGAAPFKAFLASSFMTVLTLHGCAPSLVTSGSHSILPPPETQMVVWGNESSTTSMALTWLQARGYRIVERARLDQIFEEQAIRLQHIPDSQAQILRVGQLVGADMVVFVDASIRARESVEFAAYGGIAAGERKTVYNASVTVRGVHVESSEVLWSGSARFTEPVTENLDHALIILTCHALRTAWGDERPGSYMSYGDEAC